MSNDVFRPCNEPARTLYDAFQDEAQKRKGRDFDVSMKEETTAVWRAAAAYAKQQGLAAPTLQEVDDAQRYAMGSVDYGAQWAYALTRKMLEGKDRQQVSRPKL